MGILEDLGDYSYYCPHCNEDLKNDIGIEFKVKLNTGKFHQIFLDPTLGKYEFRFNYDDLFKQDERVEFYCGKCDESLTSDRHEDYVKIMMKVSTNVEFEILFSCIYGKKSTYLVDENFMETFGIDSDLNNPLAI